MVWLGCCLNRGFLGWGGWGDGCWVGWSGNGIGGGLVGRGRFETCPYGLVGGRVALMEMRVLGPGGWLVGLLLPNWAGGSGWLNDN